MRTVTAEDLPQVSPAVSPLSGFIKVCLALLVLEVGVMMRSHADIDSQSMKPTHTIWRSLTL